MPVVYTAANQSLAERRADVLDVAAQPAMCWIGIQPWVPEQ
jgi:hypothetical protein